MAANKKMYKKVCPICGGQFDGLKNRIYCYECGYAIRRDGKNKAKIDRKDLKKNRHKTSIEEVCRLASEAGMTYGEYVNSHKEVG